MKTILIAFLLYKQFQRTQLLGSKSSNLLALSGGQDSVCLFLIIIVWSFLFPGNRKFFHFLNLRGTGNTTFSSILFQKVEQRLSISNSFKLNRSHQFPKRFNNEISNKHFLISNQESLNKKASQKVKRVSFYFNKFFEKKNLLINRQLVDWSRHGSLFGYSDKTIGKNSTTKKDFGDKSKTKRINCKLLKTEKHKRLFLVNSQCKLERERPVLLYLSPNKLGEHKKLSIQLLENCVFFKQFFCKKQNRSCKREMPITGADKNLFFLSRSDKLLDKQIRLSFSNVVKQGCKKVPRKVNFASVWCNHLWQKDGFYTMRELIRLSFLWKIPFYGSIALFPNLTEQKARLWRYKKFSRILAFYQFNQLLTGHTATDRAETLLLHLLRGSGTAGLISIPWKRSFSLPLSNSFPTKGFSYFLTKKVFKSFTIKQNWKQT